MKKYKITFEGERCSRTYFVKCGDYYREAIDIAYERMVAKYGEAFAYTVAYCIRIHELRCNNA